MKRKLLTVLLLVAPYLLIAQVYTNKDKTLISSRIDTLIQNYMQKSGLTLPGGNKRNDKVVGDLRAMIKTDAEIFDDINATYNERKQQYELKNKSRNTYIDDLVDAFPKGLIVINKNVSISYADFDKGEVFVALERHVEGTNAQKYIFNNDDTLLITIGILADKSVKITNISKIGSNIKCMNDDDIDGVIDELDECRNVKGLASLNGCPDRDEDGIPDKRDECPNESGPASNNGCPPSTFAYQFVFSGGAGYQFSRNEMEELKSGALNGYKYIEDDNGNSDLNKVSKAGTVANPSFYANVAYYFGKNKNNKTTGVSLGFAFNSYEDRYNIGGLKYFYNGNESGNSANDYHQIITLSPDAYEDLRFTMFNFPLMLRYKKKFGTNLAGEISAGPSLLYVATKSKHSGLFDFEAIYEYESDGTRAVYERLYSEDLNDWVLTEKKLEGQRGNGNNPDPKKYFEDLYNHNREYNVGLDIPIVTDAKIKNRISYAINVTADLFYHLGPKTAVKFGGTLLYSGLKGKNDNYSMVKRRDDTNYHSIYDSNIKSKYLAYGFNVGIIIGI